MNQIWTQDRLDVLKAYLEGGLSYSDIAAKFKTNNDVIQKVVKRYNLKKYIKQVEKEIPILDLDELNDENFDEQKEAAKLQWKIPTSKIITNGKKGFKTYIVVTDLHVPEQNTSAVNCVLQVMDDIKFDGILNLGDYLDLAVVSHWNKNKHKTLEGKRLKNDYIMGNALLDEFDKRLPKNSDKRFFKGNHEQWIDDLVEENPALDGLFDIASGLKLQERGYKVYSYNHIERIGRLCMTHGMYATTNTVKKHLDELKVNIMIGHGHQIEQRMASSAAREISLAGYEVGCLTNLDPDYAKHRANCHSHGFAIVYFYPNGYFDVNLVRIISGKCIVRGKEYDGNK
jgi:predicted DNA-binding protein YlxM (UPF0122 family)